MRCGFAEIEITPPVGTWLHGFGVRDLPSQGVRDPLYAQAAVFEEAGARAAVVSADILSFHPQSVARIRARASRRIPMDPGSILLAATHTHAGPAVADIRGMGPVDPLYLEELERRIVEVVRLAFEALQEAGLMLCVRVLRGIGYRREAASSGGTPSDEDLMLLAAISPGTSRALGLIWSYPCHPVTLGPENLLISADYPGAVRASLKKRSGAPVLHLQSASGDVDPLSFASPNRDGPAASAEVDRIGELIGRQILRMIESGRRIHCNGLRVVDSLVRLPVRPLSLEDLAEIESQARADSEWLGGRDAEKAAVKQLEISRGWACDMRRLRAEGAYPDWLACPVQGLTIGEARIIGVGAEVFGEVGLAVRKSLGRDSTLFAGYANGCIGYVPSAAGEAASYATRIAPQWYGTPPLAPEADRVLVDGIGRLTAAL